MKITLCGSINFYEEMLKVKEELEKKGHEVKLPPIEVENDKGERIPVKQYYQLRKEETNDSSWVWKRKEEAMRVHFDKVAWSDSILVLNYTKRDIENYIGGNTLMEMSLAFHLNKKIFLLNNIPELSYKEEILGMFPVIINNNLELIK